MKIPDIVQKRAKSVGDSAENWLKNAPSIIDVLQEKWQLSEIAQPLAGGSESLVLPVTNQDGQPAILKIGMPTVCDVSTEAKVYAMTNGVGYAQLYEHNADHNAILVERLGPTLDEIEETDGAKIEKIAVTLRIAWVPLTQANGMMTGAEKAQWLANFINAEWRALGQPFSKHLFRMAVGFAEERAAAHDPQQCVLVHGDAHAANTLADGQGGYKFIDPDGLFAERACDLAVPMREHDAELLAGDPLELGLRRCHFLSAKTSVPQQAIWQWGFVERVSTSLVLLRIGLKDEAREMMKIAESWAHFTG